MGDHDDAVLRPHDGRPIHEVHRRHGLCGAAGLLQHGGPELGRMLARAGPHEPDPMRAMQPLRRGVHLLVDLTAREELPDLLGLGTDLSVECGLNGGHPGLLR